MDILPHKTLPLFTIGVAFVISVVMVLLFRWFAGLILWAFIICMVCLTTLLGVLFVTFFSTENEPNLFYFGIGLLVFAALQVIIVLCLCRKIRQSITVINIASHFIVENPFVILTQLIFCLVKIAWVLLMILTAILILSIQTKNYQEQLETPNYVNYAFGFSIFSGLWVYFYIDTLLTFVIATAFSLWMTRKFREASCIQITGLLRGLFVNFGSLAFASLLKCLLFIVQWMLNLAAGSKVRKAGGGSPAASFMIGCFTCFANFANWVLSFITDNAVIQVAITGNSFCSSVNDGAKIAIDNPIKFLITSFAQQVLYFLGVICIGCLCGGFALLMLRKTTMYETDQNTEFILIGISALIGYIIGTVTMSALGVSIQTSLHCVCMGMDSDKKVIEQYKCQKEIQEFMDVEE